MLCGLVTTIFIPETKRKTLEELAGEVPGTANYDPATAGHDGLGAAPTYRGSDGTDSISGSGEEKHAV